MKQIVIVDYEMGNIHSIENAFLRLGARVVLSRDKKTIEKADALVLPGVGAFGQAMENLEKFGLIESLHQAVIDEKKPILGICLGMQLFGKSSSENGLHAGLEWIEGNVVAIEPKRGYLVPHVGWNTVEIKKGLLFEMIEEGDHFYFDHSFHLQTDDTSIITAVTHYSQTMTVAIEKENIFGVQFHPEKSQIKGLKVLRSFLNHVKTGAYGC